MHEVGSNQSDACCVHLKGSTLILLPLFSIETACARTYRRMCQVTMQWCILSEGPCLYINIHLYLHVYVYIYTCTLKMCVYIHSYLSKCIRLSFKFFFLYYFIYLQSKHTQRASYTRTRKTESVLTERPTSRLEHGGVQANKERHKQYAGF